MEKIPISKYLPYYSKKSNQFVPGCIPRVTNFYKEILAIKNGEYKDIIEKCRSIAGKKEREQFKAQNLLGLTISATCTGWRKLENMQKYSGLLGIDIDSSHNPHITDWAYVRDKLGNRPSVVASFLSASGKGCYFVVRSTKETHKDLFDYLLFELEKAGIIADVSGGDYLRLRFVSYDPGTVFKPDLESVPFITPTEEFRLYQEKIAEEQRKQQEAFEREFGKFIGRDNSPEMFEKMFVEFIKYQELRGKRFVQGNRHFTLVGICGHCIKYGFPKSKAIELVTKYFAGVAGATADDCIYTVNHVYKTYTKL